MGSTETVVPFGQNALAQPRPGLIILLIVTPIAQILIGAIGTVILVKESALHRAASFIGNPFLALLAIGLAFFLLARAARLGPERDRGHLRGGATADRLDPAGRGWQRRVRRGVAGQRDRGGALFETASLRPTDHRAGIRNGPRKAGEPVP